MCYVTKENNERKREKDIQLYLYAYNKQCLSMDSMMMFISKENISCKVIAYVEAIHMLALLEIIMKIKS